MEERLSDELKVHSVSLAEVAVHLVYIREHMSNIEAHLAKMNGRVAEHDRFITAARSWGAILMIAAPLAAVGGRRALVIMVPVLTIVCDVVAILGGWIIAVFIAHVTSTMYWSAVKERLIFGNIFIGLFKPVMYSLVIAFVSCYKGFTSEGGTKGVGRATTESVVLSSITILVVNFFITKVVFSLIKGYL